MKKLKFFEEPILVIKSYAENSMIFMSVTFDVAGEYDPEADWMD